MRLTDVLVEDNIIADIGSRAKAAVLDEVVSELALRTPGLDKTRALDAIFEREKLGTTGIGHGVAIPHGKVKGLSELIVCFARSRKGVDFASMDKLPVHLIFLILAPVNSASAHLKVLAAISQLLKGVDFRSVLMNAHGRTDIYRAIVEAERRGVSI